MALAVLVKPPAALVLPCILVWLALSGRARAWREVARFIAPVILLVVAADLPFWSGVSTLHDGVAEGWYITSSPAAVVLPLVRAAVFERDASFVVAVVARLLFVVVAALVLFRRARGVRIDTVPITPLT